MPHKFPFWIRAIEGTQAGAGAAPGGETPPPSSGPAAEETSGGQTPPPGNDPEANAEDKTDEGTQEEDPKARGSKESVLADLARERDKRQALEAKVAEFERAQMTEAEKAEADRKQLEEKYAAATAKIAEYERKQALAEISAEFNIPAAMAGRIQGATPEEMRADAKALADSLGPYTGPSDPSAGQGGGKPALAASLDAAIAAAYTK